MEIRSPMDVMVMIHGRNLENIHKELAIQYIFTGAISIPKIKYYLLHFLKLGEHMWTVSVSKTRELNRKQAQCHEVRDRSKIAMCLRFCMSN